jgi:uncharacterized protein YjaZ
MKTNWIPTHEYYRRIIQALDASSRHQLYLDLLVQPWKPMMEMMSRSLGPDHNDTLAGARAWAWLLPDQVTEMAAMLDKLEGADAWMIGQEALTQAAARFDAWSARIPFDKVTGWLVLADPARRLIGQGLGATGFNVIRSYLFGDALAERSGYAPLGGMPTYGGYAIGYHVVQAFLKRSGLSIEETTFVPANAIVQGSGFFE